MANYDLRQINSLIENDAKGFIEECERAYRFQLFKITEGIEKEEGRVLVMLAGPSSSGKTTTAKLLKQNLISKGRKASVISLDDFYLIQDEPHTFEDGTVDFERVEALDIPLIYTCLHELMSKGESELPKFCFHKKERSGFEKMQISADEIVIVEGLHALNPVITEPLSDEKMIKLYVSVSSRITEGERVLLTKRDLRFIRRMIRDYRHRSSDVEYTFYLWKGVRMGEDRYLFPYSGNADVKIDSIHPYEVSLFKKNATELLDRVAQDSVYYKTADELKAKLERFVALDEDVMPSDSLLGEFIG